MANPTFPVCLPNWANKKGGGGEKSALFLFLFPSMAFVVFDSFLLWGGLSAIFHHSLFSFPPLLLLSGLTHPPSIGKRGGWRRKKEEKEEGQSKVLIFRSPSSSSRFLGRGFLGVSVKAHDAALTR